MAINIKLKAFLACIAITIMLDPSAWSDGPENKDDASAIVAAKKGEVLVLLLGMEGCPGTEKATPLIAEYSKTKPEGVSVYLVDVPLPGKKAIRTGAIPKGLGYAVDKDRKLAEKLEFFFYPTTYVFDRDSAVRFSGEFRLDEIRKMVDEILSEKSGAEKKIYTPPLLKIGDAVPDFKTKSAEGEEVSLKEICADAGAVLFFGSRSCPFSVEALSDFSRLIDKFDGKELGFAVVGFGEKMEDIKDFYGENAPGAIVIADSDKTIGSGTFSVPAVPFFYLLDKDMKVVERKPFQYDSASTAIARMLGMKTGGDQPPAKVGVG